MPTQNPSLDEASIAAEISGRSQTLWERLEQAPASQAPGYSAEQLAKLLSTWSRVAARGDHQRLLRRLRWDNIDPQRAALALASPPGTQQAAPWTGELLSYVQKAAVTAAGAPAHDSSSRWQKLASETPFGELWLPWIDLAAERLRESSASELALLSDAAYFDLRAQLLAEISWMSELAAHERFEKLRETDDSKSGELYRRFVSACLANPVAQLYQHYPVLARQTCRRLRQWRESVSDFLTRLSRDHQEIARTFAGGADPGPVAHIRGGVSDRHHDGRQVMLLTFESGLRLAYKPRSLGPEAALERFVGWCSEAGLSPAPRAARVLAKSGYGWMEMVSQDALPSPEAAPGYYRRAGILLALAYVLRAEDLNGENVVATLDGPVIVDAEVILQPIRAKWTSGETARTSDLESGASCLKTGLLTQLLPDGAEDSELGGLRGWTERDEPRRIWSGLGTDSITVAAGKRTIGPLTNAVLIDNRLIDPASHAEALLDGFAAGYRFFLEQRPALCADGGPLDLFCGVPLRVLFRASQEYGRVVQLMELPRNQRSGLTGSWLQEALLPPLLESEERNEFWPLIREERHALEKQDLPWFALSADEDSVRTRQGEPVVGLFDCSGLESVRRRVQGLSEEDLREQLGLARRALEPPPPAGPMSRLLRESADQAEPRKASTSYRDLAAALGESLAAQLDSPAPQQTLPTAWSLESGRLGTALFLAALAAAGQGEHFAKAAERLAQGLDPSRVKEPSAEPGIGGFTGGGSLVWALVWLSRLLEKPALLDAARDAARALTPEAIDSDRRFDICHGAAGALLGLLALAEEAGDDEALALARACGQHLLSHQVVCASAGAAWANPRGLFQAGWTHGAAGIARALAALGEATSDNRFLAGAAAAIGYERSLYSREHRNWPVHLIDAGGRRTRSWMVSSCRGAPGIALSRLLLPSILRDEMLAAELEVALDTTATAKTHELDHLCCGSMGRSSVLLTAAELGGSVGRRKAAENLAEVTIQRAASTGGFSVSADCYEDPRLDSNFLHGRAGICYQLLRLAGVDSIPDVLALELPSEQTARVGGAELREVSS